MHWLDPRTGSPKVNLENVLLVDDNRDHENWGGRSTSMALYELLAANGFHLQSTLDMNTTHRHVPVTYLPWLRPLYRNGFARLLLTHLVERGHKSRSALRLLGHQDFIARDPDKSVRNVLRLGPHYDAVRLIVEKTAAADVVVINGEGSIIFNTLAKRDLLFQLMMVHLARTLEKPVFYVNALVSDPSDAPRNDQLYEVTLDALEKCSGVTVRDRQSHEMLASSGRNIDFEYIPDAVFSWYYLLGAEGEGAVHLPTDTRVVVPHPEYPERLGWDFREPYICVGGSAAAALDPQKACRAYSGLVEGLKSLGLPIYLAVTCPGDDFLNEVGERTGTPVIPVNTNILVGGTILAHSRLLVSGRYHPSILASLGGAPCVFMGSDSHKTRSLQDVLEYESPILYSTFPSEQEYPKIVEHAKQLLDAGSELRARISRVAANLGEEAARLPDFISDRLLREQRKREHDDAPAV